MGDGFDYQGGMNIRNSSSDPRIRNMSFTRQGLIAMVEVKDAEEFEPRLIKVAYR